MLLDLPSNRSESWRWSDLSALPALAAATPTGRVPDDLPWLDCDKGPCLLFVDGALRSGDVEIGPLAIDSAHPLGRLAGKSGWSLELGRDHAPPGLVQIVHVSTGAADHLAAEILLGDDAQASIVVRGMATSGVSFVLATDTPAPAPAHNSGSIRSGKR